MIFELVTDFAAVLEAMPADHPRRRILKLLDEAVRRDVHFIARHPTTLFQCMWNTCWWYDCPEWTTYYEFSEQAQGALRASGPAEKLSTMLERWRQQRQSGEPQGDSVRKQTACWLRALVPPAIRLGDDADVHLRGNYDVVFDVSFSPDGRKLATAGIDLPTRGGTAALTLWHAKHGFEIGSFPHLQHRSGQVESAGPVRWFPNGKELAVATVERTGSAVRGNCYHVLAETGRILGQFAIDSGITAMDIHPSGTSVAVAGFRLARWDVQTGRSEISPVRMEAATASLRFTDDGSRIVTGGCDGTVRVWRFRDLQPVATHQVHGADFVRAAPIPGVEFFLSCEQGWCTRDEATNERWSRVAVRELSTGAVVEELFYTESGEAVNDVAVARNGELLAFSIDADVCVVDVVKRQATRLAGPSQVVTSLCLSSDGEQLAACGGSTAKIWNHISRRGDSTPGEFKWPTDTTALRPDGKMLATISAWKPGMKKRAGDVWLWDAKGAYRRLAGPASFIRWSQDTSTLFAAGWMGPIRIWRLGPSAPHDYDSCQLPEDKLLLSIAVSPDDKLLAVTLNDGSVRIFDTETGEARRILTLGRAERLELSDTETQLAFSPGSRILAATGNVSSNDDPEGQPESSFVRTWDVTVGRPLSRTELQAPTIEALDVSPDESLIAAGRENGRLELWSSATGELCGVLSGHTGPVDRVLFHPDGRYLLSSQELHAVPQTFLWDLKAMTPAHRWRGSFNLSQLAASIRDGAVTARTLIGCALTADYQVVRLPDFRRVAAVPREVQGEYAFHPQTHVLAGCAGTQLFLYRLESENV